MWNIRIINPPDPKIFESWMPFQDFFREDHRAWIVPDTDKIKSMNEEFDFVLANCSAEHWGIEQDFPLVVRIHDLLAEYFSGNFVCLCHHPADADLRPNIIYFPFFAWFKRWQPVNPAQIANVDRTFLFSNLNRHSRDFRVANYLALRKKSYAGRCLLTMHNRDQEDHDYDRHFDLNAQERQDWQLIKSQLPNEVCDGFGLIFALAHPAFADSYLHIVTESTIHDKIFVTEKTWQPVLAGQLFVVWGNAGLISHLRDLQVDVFDDVINHDYDLLQDHRQRLHRLHQELDRLALMDWSSIYQHTLPRRQSNAAAFAAGDYTAPYLALLKSKLPEIRL